MLFTAFQNNARQLRAKRKCNECNKEEIFLKYTEQLRVLNSI